MKTLLTTIITGILIVIAIGLATERICQQNVIETESGIKQKQVMSIIELQEFLNSQDNNRYYCGKIDGICGKQTIRAWNNYCNDQACRQAWVKIGGL